MSPTVALYGFEHHACSEAASDTRLHDSLSAKVPDQAPRGLPEPNISVVPSTEGAATHLQIARGEVVQRGVPHLLEAVSLVALPIDADQFVKSLLVRLRDFVW